MLAELAKHPGRVLTHAHLLKTAWGPAQEGQTEYLRVRHSRTSAKAGAGSLGTRADPKRAGRGLPPLGLVSAWVENGHQPTS